MNEKERVLGEAMREAFGSAPQACRREMRDTLAGLKEEQSVKKGRFGLVFAAALLVVLCGSAIAARQLGVLDFLFAGEDTDDQVARSVQSAFVQTDGDMGPVRAEVRDAVSDGIAVHMVVAYEVVDEQDVVLMEYDTDLDAQGEQGPYPHPGGWTDDTRKWVVWCPEAMAEAQFALSGVDWRYESPQVLLVQYVLDLEALETVPEEITVRFTSGVHAFESTSEWPKPVPITVTLAAGDMEKQVVKAVREVEFSGISLNGLEATLTPLATYVTLDYEVLLPVEAGEIEDAYRRWSDTYGNLWFDLLDASGEPVPRFTGGRKWGNNDIHPIQETVKVIFAALPEKPESMTFAPYDSATGERLPAFTVPVE